MYRDLSLHEPYVQMYAFLFLATGCNCLSKTVKLSHTYLAMYGQGEEHLYSATSAGCGEGALTGLGYPTSLILEVAVLTGNT